MLFLLFVRNSLVALLEAACALQSAAYGRNIYAYTQKIEYYALQLLHVLCRVVNIETRVWRNHCVERGMCLCGYMAVFIGHLQSGYVDAHSYIHTHTHTHTHTHMLRGYLQSG